MSNTKINNTWINHEDDLFLFFGSSLSLEVDTYKDALFNLNLEIHKLTTKHELLMPLSPEYCSHYKIDATEHYKQFLLQNQEDPKPFQIKGYEFYNYNINQVSKIYFRNKQGEIVSKYVHYLSNGYYGNPVIIESKLKFDKTDPIHNYSYDDCPLRIASRTVSKSKTSVEVSFIIESHCSIWLDKTPNFKFLNKEGKIDFFEYSDNKEITYKNTPRLNSFLRDLKKLIINYGGNCFLYDYESYLSSHKLNRAGLLLEGQLIYEENRPE